MMQQFFIFLIITFNLHSCQYMPAPTGAAMLTYEVDPAVQELRMFWKDSEGKRYGNAGWLAAQLASQGLELKFAMNGGMFDQQRAPVGLYIEQGQTLAALNTTKDAYGNFYMQPNGVFYLSSDQKGHICKTDDFEHSANIEYATQSGPLLLVDGKINNKFGKSSSSVHTRNGVGVLPNGNLLFAQSKSKVNFYTFAQFFKEKGCTNALYLDGFVSKTYLPSQNWKQTGGDFGVMIGQTIKK